jgi:hypothetical protein
MGLQTVSIALSKQGLEGLDGELGERNADLPSKTRATIACTSKF